ncbi:unnamed protein product [Symbiodinium sp. CCMP2592]|nr:unnamed protein product [Symbiodinium sp. CCMP2592]
MSAMEEGWQILPPQPEAGQQDVEMGSPRPAAASSPLKATPPRQPKEEGSPPTSSTRDSGPPDASDEDHDDSSALFGELEELDAPEPKKAPSLDLQALAKFMHDSEPALKTSCGEDVVLLLGSTGSGKTSLVYSMSGLRLVAASHGAAGKKVYEAEKALDGFTIGHEETSETQNLRAHRLSSGTVIVDAPGQFDTRGSEVDIATSALCRQLATKCRKLRFVMLVDCGSLLHCRMGSLRQITSMIREALPDFPRNQAHRGAVCFLFTHLEKVTPYPMPSDRDEALKQARATVAELLSRALHGTDWNDDCRIVLQWMCQAIQMYNDGKLKVRLVDVYHPEWSTMEDLAAGVELFNKRGYSLGFGGESPGESVRYILTHQSKAKLNISLKHLTANFQIKLREGRTDEVRDLWQSIEMLHTYLASHPDVMSCLREMKDLLGGTHLQLQHEATCLMQRCESDAEDFDLSQVKRLQGLICQLERLPSNPIDCGLDFVHKLRMRANGCMRQHGAHVISGFCNDKLPDTRKLCRCMAKLSAWASAEPNEFEELHHQAARAQRDYLEQVAKRTSSLESLPETDVETQVWATAQLEHLSLHAEALGAESDAAEKGWATAQHMLKERLDDFRHHVKTSAGSILDGTDKELSWSGVRAAIASIDACAKRVQEDAAGAHQTARCLEAIRRSIIGDIQELLSNLRGEAEAVLPEHGDVALAAGTKVKQAYDAMSALVATLPLPERASCNRSYCHMAAAQSTS